MQSKDFNRYARDMGLQAHRPVSKEMEPDEIDYLRWLSRLNVDGAIEFDYTGGSLKFITPINTIPSNPRDENFLGAVKEFWDFYYAK